MGVNLDDTKKGGWFDGWGGEDWVNAAATAWGAYQSYDAKKEWEKAQAANANKQASYMEINPWIKEQFNQGIGAINERDQQKLLGGLGLDMLGHYGGGERTVDASGRIMYKPAAGPLATPDRLAKWQKLFADWSTVGDPSKPPAAKPEGGKPGAGTPMASGPSLEGHGRGGGAANRGTGFQRDQGEYHDSLRDTGQLTAYDRITEGGAGTRGAFGNIEESWQQTFAQNPQNQQAVKAYNDWISSLSPEELKAEAAKQKAIDQKVRQIGLQVGKYVGNAATGGALSIATGLLDLAKKVGGDGATAEPMGEPEADGSRWYRIAGGALGAIGGYLLMGPSGAMKGYKAGSSLGGTVGKGYLGEKPGQG